LSPLIERHATRDHPDRLELVADPGAAHLSEGTGVVAFLTLDQSERRLPGAVGIPDRVYTLMFPAVPTSVDG
jgi:hypothetical protein